MNISVAISAVATPDEHYDALLAVVESANVSVRAENARRAAQTPPQAALAEYTPQTYLEKMLTNAVDSYAQQRYDAALKRLGVAAAAMPYANRLALIEQVEAQVS